MCIITAEEEEASRRYWIKVSKTNIFARHTKPGYQAIAYSLSIASRTRAAMILPLPVVPGSGENALKFIDLSGYPDFFIDLSRVCESEHQIEYLDFDDFDAGEENETLLVHDVGDYEASYVPTMADFGRLDPRFRLANEIWKKMPNYNNFGFAVFQLKITLSKKEEETENAVHPMAFEFPTRNSEKLFYPTVHVHDGDYHSEAGFYHTFYCQRDKARSEFKYQRDLLYRRNPTPAEKYEEALTGPFEGYDWYLRSNDIASNLIQTNKCQGIVDPDKKLYGMVLFGDFPNSDIWLGDTVQDEK